MAVYEIKADEIVPLSQTSFEAAGVRERADLQRLLRAHVEVVCPDVLVIAEEFCAWEDSRCRVDLLAVDRDANLVVIELKRTEDAGLAQLQAVRYAAMVSAMTFDEAAAAYADYLRRGAGAAHAGDGQGAYVDAATRLLRFLGWDEPDEDRFAQDVRIVLVAADFSRELTTAVMWLNQRNLDIRCVRLRPYQDGNRLLVDVQQVIPLPEAEDYVIRIRRKAVREREDRAERGERDGRFEVFWRDLLDMAGGEPAPFAAAKQSRRGWLDAGSGLSGVVYEYALRQHRSIVQLLLIGDREVNKARFDWFYQRRPEIEQAVGHPLVWNRGDDTKRSTLVLELPGGYRDEEQWPEI